MQEALDTLVVRIVEEKAEPLVAQVVEPPDSTELSDPADLIAVLDMYLALLSPAKDILAEFVAKVSKELPVTTHSQPSLEALSSILQVCEVHYFLETLVAPLKGIAPVKCMLTIPCESCRPPTLV